VNLSAKASILATLAKRLGMDFTTVAHHLALLDPPAPLAAASKSG
jgi:hypothetical protein